jgi:hypothetical protein
MRYEQQRHIWEDNFKPIYARNDIFSSRHNPALVFFNNGLFVRAVQVITTNSIEHSPFFRHRKVALQVAKKMPHFIKFDGSYLYSQKPTTWIQSITNHPISLSTILILSCHLCPNLNKWSLCYRFPHQNPLCISLLPICSTWPAHLIHLNFITRII